MFMDGSSSSGEDLSPVEAEARQQLAALELLLQPSSNQVQNDSLQGYLQDLCHLMGGTNVDLDADALEHRMQHLMLQVNSTQAGCERASLLDMATGEGQTNASLIARARAVVRVLQRTLQGFRTLTNLVRGDGSAVSEQEADDFNSDGLNDRQRLELYALEECARRGYRRMDDQCWQEIRLTGERSDGVWIYTKAWKPVMEISDFFWEMTSRDRESGQLWLLSTNQAHNRDAVLKNLCNVVDTKFPVLKPNRCLFAFRDGIFDIAHNIFFPYCEEREWAALISEAQSKYPGAAHLTGAMPPTSADACINFIDAEFSCEEYDDISAFSNIPTPAFNEILDAQHLDQHSQDNIAMALGRALFPIGDKDNWQFFPFFKGVAGSGKSTLADIMRSFYPESRVGVLSSGTAEQVFGLSALADKDLFLCTEVTSDWKLPQGDFQDMVSGGKVSIPIKNKTARSIQWTTPGLLFGNTSGAWTGKNTEGSLTRRILDFPMKYRVQCVKPMLKDEFMDQRGPFLRKIVSAYLHYVSKFGSRDIWSISRGPDSKPVYDFISEFLHETRQKLRGELDVLFDFITNTEECSTEDPLAKVPARVFQQRFNQYCKEKNLPTMQWKEECYRSLFEEKNIHVTTGTHNYMGRTISGRWFEGIELLADDNNAQPVGGGGNFI